MTNYDVVIVGSGPAGLGAAFHLIENNPKLKILIIEKGSMCSGGLLNDCKQNYTAPIGFSEEHWELEEATEYLELVKLHLKPVILENKNISIYQKRASKIGVNLLNVSQYHVGTDKSKDLITKLINELKTLGVEVKLDSEVKEIEKDYISTISTKIYYKKLILAVGRKGFSFLQDVMNKFEIPYTDNIIDVGIRVETKLENYPIVKDYYDPKFYFPNKVRTFCTNSGSAWVVPEQYKDFKIVNGHSLSTQKQSNGLVNFAILKTIGLQNPVRSGQLMGSSLARLANDIGGGKPIMQRVGDFRSGKRSLDETFNRDLYNFEPTYKTTAGDIGLVVPAKIMRDIWSALKQLDTIVPGVLRPETILYYPEIKFYANKPLFVDNHFKVKSNIYMCGDVAGVSRGITGAWASGIRVAIGILKDI